VRVNSSRGTNDRNTDKGEVGGSSPPRPTINPMVSGRSPSIYAVILTFSTCRTFAQKAICQKFAKNPGELIWTQFGTFPASW